MAKVTAPTLSFGASGKLGGTLVFKRQGGQNVARKFPAPQTIITPAQREMRDLYKFLAALFPFFTTQNLACITAQASSKTVSPWNTFLKLNAKALQASADLTGLTMADPASTNPKTGAHFSLASTHQVRFNGPWPTPPAGWSAVGRTVFVIRQCNPRTSTPPTLHTNSNVYPTLAVNVSFLTPVTAYWCCGVDIYTDQNGRTVYSRPALATITTT